MPPVGDRVTWRNPTLQPAKLKCSWRFALWLAISQTSDTHLSGTEINTVVGMRVTPLRRPAHAPAGDETSVTRRTDAGKTDRVLPATPEHLSRRAVACTADHRQVKKSCHKPTRRGGQESVPARDNSEPRAVDSLRSERAETTFQRTWHALRSQCERRLLKWRSMRTVSRQND